MDKLLDFKPLERVTLPGLGDLDCSGLILVVGPNSSGKSQFLHDLDERISGAPRPLVVANDIRIRKPDLDPFLRCLIQDGYLDAYVDDTGAAKLRPQTTYVGTGRTVSEIASSQPAQWHRDWKVDQDVLSQRNTFLHYFGRLLVTALFLDKRLQAMNQTGSHDFEKQPPQHDLHALYVDDSARMQLLQEVASTFGQAIWPDTSKGGQLCLKVSDESQLPSAEDRLSPKKMARYRTIESEGDGMKSYAAVCIALLLGRRPVCLLDEPEMCLHPPQAHALGRFIGRFGNSPDTATFVSTHSSHVLRGVIQTAPKLQIVRLTRHMGAFVAHLVPFEVLRAALVKPTVRAESVLDGIFSQAVVIVEADTDRTVYQAAWETLHEEYRLDLHFAAVGGTGGIADTCKLYRTLHIPVAVIADLDMLVASERLEKLLPTLTDGETARTLIQATKTIANRVKRLPPTIAPEAVRAALGRALETRMDWELDDDAVVQRILRDTEGELDRMKRLKRGGVESLPPDLRALVEAAIRDLAGVGLFLVPVGELEQWLAGRDIAASKSNKWAWANEAAALIRRVGGQSGDVWDYMRAVGRFTSGATHP